MTQFISKLSVLVTLAITLHSSLSFADPKGEKWVAYTPPAGNVYFHPEKFFQDMRATYPEMEAINPELFQILRPIIDNEIRTGVITIDGIESNYENSFDLYMPSISRAEDFPNTQMGPDLQSDVGKIYFIEHDGAHHLAGIPGLRLSDLKDLDATKEKFTRIIFLKELFASAQTTMKFIPAYWQWREKPPADILEEFKKYNQGFHSSFKPLTSAEQVNLVESFVFGKTLDYFKQIWSNITPESVRKAKELGVPRLSPRLDRFIGSHLDNYVITYAARVIEPIRGYFAKVAYKGFSKYTKALSELVFQPWYVQWSDDFQVGIPLDQLEKRTLTLIDQLRQGVDITDPDAPLTAADLDWDRNFFNTELTLFGRRLAEVNEVMRTTALNERLASHYAQDLTVLHQSYQEAIEIHRELHSGASLDAVKEKFLALVEKVETALPVDRVIPFSHRIGGLNYVGYWRNPYAYAISRGDLPPTRFSPAYLEKKTKISATLPTAEELKTEVGQREGLQDGLIRQYRADQAERSVPMKNTIGLEEFTNKLDLLVRDNFLKQVPLMNQLSIPQKEQLESICLTYLKNLETELKACAVNTTACSSLKKADQFLVNLQSVAKDLKNGKKLSGLMLSSLEYPIILDSPSRSFSYVQINGEYHFDDQMIDLVHPSFDLNGKPVLSRVQPYTSMAEWLNHDKVKACGALLKAVSASG